MLISLDINNPIILKELEELEGNEDKKEEYLKTILDIGSSILNSSTEIVNDCRLMGPFKELLKQCEDKINENIDDKLGSLVGKNSSMLGKFSENIYEKIVKRSFPEYTIINTATSGEKCGDIVSKDELNVLNHHRDRIFDIQIDGGVVPQIDNSINIDEITQEIIS